MYTGLGQKKWDSDRPNPKTETNFISLQLDFDCWSKIQFFLAQACVHLLLIIYEAMLMKMNMPG